MSRLAASLVLLATFLFLSACGGGDATSPAGQKSIGVSLASTELSAPAGGTTTVGVNITRGGGFSGSVTLQLEGTPTGVTISFSPHPVPGSASSSTMSIAVASTVTPGRYLMSVQAVGAGVEEGGKAQLWLNVLQAPDYSLRPARDTISVIQGASGQIDVNLTRVSGYAGEVTLTLEGSPEGVTGTFTPNPATADRSTLTLNVGASAAAGKYALTVRGAASGLTAHATPLVLEVLAAAAPGFTISVSPSALTVVSGGSSVAATVTIRRTGGFAGAVALSAQGHPNGVTCTPPIPVTDSLGTLTFTAAIALTGGTYPVTIVGKASGYPDRQATLQLTVAEQTGFWLTLSSSSITTANGAAPQNVTVQITRTGGFTDTVHLAMTGLPSGISATFNPAATVGGSQLTIAAVSAVAGTYTGTLHATAAGQNERTTTITITVAASATDILWRFCSPGPTPVFIAVQDGVSPYVAVTPAGDGSYTTAIASGKGTVVFVVPGLPATTDAAPMPVTGLRRSPGIASSMATGYTTYMYYGTTADLQAVAQAQCAAGSKTVRGSVAGVQANDAWSVGLGGASTIGLPGGGNAFTLSNVLSGARDLVAARAPTGGPILADAFIIRRDVNAADGSTLPTIDFGGGETFAPATGTLTVNGIPAGARTEVVLGFSTANGSSTLTGQLDSVTSAARAVVGVPSAQLRAGDLHTIQSTSEGSGIVLTAMLYASQVAAWNISLPSWPQPASADVFATAPIVRMRARGGFGAQGGAFGGMVHATFVQAGAQRAAVIYESRNYAGSAGNYELRTGGGYNTLPGWSEANYGFQAGAVTSWTVEVLTPGYSYTPADGNVLYTLRTSGQLTP